MALTEEKLEAIGRWRVNAALRGIKLFDNDDEDYNDSNIYDIIYQLSEHEEARKERNKHQLIADEFITLGLTATDYCDYLSLLEEQQVKKLRDAWQAEFEGNELVQVLHNKYGFKETKGRGKKPFYFEVTVDTDQHGPITAKCRMIPAKYWYQTSEAYAEFRLPTKEKIVWSTNCKIIVKDHRFPKSWWDNEYRDYRSDETKRMENAHFFANHFVRQLERVYKKTSNRKKKTNE